MLKNPKIEVVVQHRPNRGKVKILTDVSVLLNGMEVAEKSINFIKNRPIATATLGGRWNEQQAAQEFDKFVASGANGNRFTKTPHWALFQQTPVRIAA